VKLARWNITREADDKLAVARVSLGKAPGDVGSYLVFRGDPADVVELLESALAVARAALPVGRYADKRGRPQG
jgi:hypothetical protein